MKILFIGQKGIPCVTQDDKIGRERRVDALATLLAKKGHKVMVTCTKPYTPKSLRKFNGVLLKHVPSLHPEVPGGWLYDCLSILYIAKFKPAVVHMNGWRMAALAPIAIVLRPQATYIWTIDTWPTRKLPIMKWLARLVDGLFDVVTTPSRELQHKILHYLQIRGLYVPDGYGVETWPTLGLTRFGIKVPGYSLTTATSPADVKKVAMAYKKAGMRRKLVVAEELKGSYKRLKSKFHFLHFTGKLGERARHAIVQGAGIVILSGEKTTLNEVLAAMDCGKGMVATTDVGYQEVLGVASLMVKAGDVNGLAEAIRTLSLSANALSLGRQAQKRARAHFTWQRVLPEYVELYNYPVLRPVWLDSARAKLVAKKA